MPLANSDQHSNLVASTRRSTGPQDLLPYRTEVQARPPCAPCPPLVTVNRGSTAPPEGGYYPKAAAGNSRAASCSSLRLGEVRLEGTSQRPFLLSSPAVGSLVPRYKLRRSVARDHRPTEGLSPPTNSWRLQPLPAANASFLPWVCVPFEARHRCSAVTAVSRDSDPTAGSVGARTMACATARTRRPGQCLSGPSALRPQQAASVGLPGVF